jgi:hypothetical protein
MMMTTPILTAVSEERYVSIFRVEDMLTKKEAVNVE